MRFIGPVLLLVNAAAYGWVGVSTLLDPSRLLGPIGIRLGADGVIEARATYGGLMLALAAAFLAAAFLRNGRRPGLQLLLLVSAGLAAGRLYALLHAGFEAGGLIWGFLAYEATTALVAAFCLVGVPRQ